jgi:hypothetical protein
MREEAWTGGQGPRNSDGARRVTAGSRAVGAGALTEAAAEAGIGDEAEANSAGSAWDANSAGRVGSGGANSRRGANRRARDLAEAGPADASGSPIVASPAGPPSAGNTPAAAFAIEARPPCGAWSACVACSIAAPPPAIAAVDAATAASFVPVRPSSAPCRRIAASVVRSASECRPSSMWPSSEPAGSAASGTSAAGTSAATCAGAAWKLRSVARHFGKVQRRRLAVDQRGQQGQPAFALRSRLDRAQPLRHGAASFGHRAVASGVGPTCSGTDLLVREALGAQHERRQLLRLQPLQRLRGEAQPLVPERTLGGILELASLVTIEVDLEAADVLLALRADRERLVSQHRPDPRQRLRRRLDPHPAHEDLEAPLICVMGVIRAMREATREAQQLSRVVLHEAQHRVLGGPLLTIASPHPCSL